MKTIKSMKVPSADRQSLCLPRLAVALTLFVLLLQPGAAKAQLTFTFTHSTLAARSGDTVTFSGTLTNQSTSELFLNGDTFMLPGSNLTLDDSPFLTNFPLSLAGGATAKGALFTVAVDPTTPEGLYDGSFTIVGGPGYSDTTSLATQSFRVVVPEPGVYALLLSGGVALGIVGLRCRHIDRD